MKRIYILAAVAMMFTACNKDTEAPDKDDQVQFTTTITRASGTIWDERDQIGVFMKKAGSGSENDINTAVLLEADNVLYTNASGTFSTLTPIYYPPGLVDFIAYYPYRATPDPDPYVYKVDVLSQKFIDIDLLYSNNAQSIVKRTTAVPLTFSHKLCKVVLRTMKGDGMGDSDNFSTMQVNITGMPTTADFELSTGELSNRGTIADIKPNTLGFSSVTEAEGPTDMWIYEAIIIPQEDGIGRKIVFTVSDQTHIYEIDDDFKFESGNSYVYDIKVNKMEVLVTVNAITDWNPTSIENIDANVEEPILPDFQEEANSYMVAPGGKEIMIPLSWANLTNEIDATVEYVWSDFPIESNKSEVIENMNLSGNYIHVKSGVEGNAVICIKQDDVIKWSWHIWVTNEVGNATDSGTGLTWMDRNLGAKSNTPFLQDGDSNIDNAQWVKTLGLYYQWGRKDAFPGSNGTNANQTYYTPDSQDNAAGNLPTSETTTLDFLVKNPLTFIINNAFTGSDGDNSWDDDGVKSIYDPCPPGWRVPTLTVTDTDTDTGTETKGSWGIVTNWSNNNVAEIKGYIFHGTTTDPNFSQYYPNTGNRSMATAEVTGVTVNDSFYWAAGVNNHGQRLHLSIDNLETTGSTLRNFGFPVRCVADTVKEE